MKLSTFFSFKNQIMASCILLGAASLVSCKSCDDGDEPKLSEDFDRQNMLSNYSENIIGPAFGEFAALTAQLHAEAQLLASSPSESQLVATQDAWRASLHQWQRVAPYDFGPAADQFLATFANIYPSDTQQIEENISTGNYNLGAANQLDAQGFQALDYLLFGDSNAALVALFQPDSQRSTYLTDITAKLSETAAVIAEEWTHTGVYGSAFANNDGVDQGSSLAQMLNSIIKSYEKDTRTLKLGLPAGALSFSMQPVPELVEAYYENDNSVAYLRSSVDHFRELYTGGEGSGLDDYLVALDAQYNGQSLNDAIMDQMQEIDAAITTLQDPLSNFVVSDQEQALEVYSELQQLVVLWKVDMMSALGILVTYQDNDGD